MLSIILLLLFHQYYSIKPKRQKPIAIARRLDGPIVSVKRKIMEGPVGEQVELECQIEAYPPASDIRWIRSQDQTELSGASGNGAGGGGGPNDPEKYHIRSYEADSNQLSITISKLTIYNLEQRDYGSYQCLASNNLTNRDAFIRLHGEYLGH